jgi:hypothetical protein
LSAIKRITVRRKSITVIIPIGRIVSRVMIEELP